MYTYINVFQKLKPRCLLRRVAIRALVHFWECAIWCVSKLHSAYHVRCRRGGPNTAGPTWSARATCRSGRTNTCLRHFSEHGHKNVRQRWWRHRYRRTEEELPRSFLEPRKEGETENDTNGKKQEDAFNETLGEGPAVPVVVRSW